MGRSDTLSELLSPRELISGWSVVIPCFEILHVRTFISYIDTIAYNLESVSFDDEYNLRSSTGTTSYGRDRGTSNPQPTGVEPRMR